MENFDLETFKKVYEKLKRKNAYFRKKGEKVDMYQDGGETIFEQSAFYDYKNQRWMTIDEIVKDKVDTPHFKYQYQTMINMVQKDYLKDIFSAKKDGIVTMLNNMGAEDISELVENMTINQFKNLWYKGGLNDVIEKYHSGVVEMAVQTQTASKTKDKIMSEYELTIKTLDKQIPQVVKNYVKSAKWLEYELPYHEYIEMIRKSNE